ISYTIIYIYIVLRRPPAQLCISLEGRVFCVSLCKCIIAWKNLVIRHRNTQAVEPTDQCLSNTRSNRLSIHWQRGLYEVELQARPLLNLLFSLRKKSYTTDS